MTAICRHLVDIHRRPTALLFLVAALCLDPVGIIAGQEPATSGVIAGEVVGPDSARLPGVTVTIASDAAVVVARVVTGDHGAYRVSAVPPGRYEVRIELPGFRPATMQADVRPGRTTRVDVALTVATLKESITVVGAAPRHSLESTRIGESGARDVGEALGAMAGVWKVRRGGIASDVVLRGYQGENLMVLIDGVRLYGACPNNMDHSAFHVDFAEVDRVEVGKGPFDLKNQGSLGGVVNIVTKRPRPGLHATPQFAFGSAGYVNPSATVSFGSDRLAVLGGYSYRTSGAYRDGAGRSFLSGANYRASAADMDVFDVQTGWGRLDLVPSQSDSLLVTFTGQRADVVFYPYLQMDALWDNADRIKAGWDSKRKIGAIEAVRTEAYATRVRHWMTDQYRVSSASAPEAYSMGTMARTDSLGARAEAVMKELTAGVDTYRREWAAETRLAMGGYQPQYSIPDVELTSVGMFGEYSRAFDRNLRLDLGGRIDYTRSRADAARANTALYRAYHGLASTTSRDTYPSAKARVAWSPRPAITVSGGAGRTVRVPDPQERYFALKRMGTDWVGNPSLRPATNTGVDLAIAFRPQRFYLNATVHHDTLGNFINVYQQARVAMVPGVMNLNARSYRNVPATMTGGEVEAVFSVTDRLFLAADVSAVRGRQRADEANGITEGNLAEIPPVRSRAAVRYDVRGERHGLFTEVEVVYSAGQGRVATELRETPTPAYAVVNARVGATARRLRLTLGVGNLLDRTYFEHLSYQRDPFRSAVQVYEPGRNIYGNVTVNF